MQKMTAVVPKSLQISNYPFPSTLNAPPTVRNPHKFFSTPRATKEEDQSPTEEEDQPPTATAVSADPSFETRLAQVRLKYRSGTGKKAEQRKSKKSGGVSSSKKKGGSGAVMLPPVPLKEPVTAGGLKVDFGFCPYSERLNGRLAALGLAALVLVELGSGKGILSYHGPPILFIQIYTVAAASALYIKYEKERISVWPKKAPSSSSSSSVVGD